MDKSTFAQNVIDFNTELAYAGQLPEGINIMNPYRENEFTLEVSSQFYRKYFSDHRPRYLVLGINPGRFGAGVTGIPFTDPKRLQEKCGIPFPGLLSHEPSSVFIYDMIEAFGGPEAFYSKFYINAVCTLGFTKTTEAGKEVNYNYYDSSELTKAMYTFIVEGIHKQISFGIDTSVCFCLGNGKNEHFLRKLNAEHRFFGRIEALEHPRYIMQYKTKSKQHYIDKYLAAFGSA
jgi:hypothetical protein